MNVLDGYGQYRRLVDEPCHGEYSFILVHDNRLTVVTGLLSKFNDVATLALDRLVHVVKASVTLHRDGASHTNGK